MISISSSKSSHSSNRSLPKCRPNWFKIQECSEISKSHLTISSTSANEVSPMNWSSTCTAEFILQAKLLFLTKVTSRRCISSDRVWSKCSTTKTMIWKWNKKRVRPINKNLFCTCLNTLTSETTKFSTTLSPTSCSRPSKEFQTMPLPACKITFFQILFSCVLRKPWFRNSVSFSLRLPKTSREELSKEERDSCSKRTPTQRELTKKRSRAKTQAPTRLITNVTRRLLTSSILMRSLRVRQVKRRTWSTT